MEIFLPFMGRDMIKHGMSIKYPAADMSIGNP